jgi:hypothetical protein
MEPVVPFYIAVEDPFYPVAFLDKDKNVLSEGDIPVIQTDVSDAGRWDKRKVFYVLYGEDVYGYSESFGATEYQEVESQSVGKAKVGEYELDIFYLYKSHPIMKESL